MSKLQDIYQRAYNNTPAATVDDNTVGEAVRKEVEREKSRAGGTLSEDEWSVSVQATDRRRALRAASGMLWH